WYFSIPKLLATFAFYLVWMRTSWWVDGDARTQHLPVRWWNAGMFGAGFLGLFLVWTLPWFVASLSVALVLYFAVTLAFVNSRNQVVGEDEKVLTKKHLQSLVDRYFKSRSGT